MNINNTLSSSILWVPTELENLEPPLAVDPIELFSNTPVTHETNSEENTRAEEAAVSKPVRKRKQYFSITHLDPQILEMIKDHKSHTYIARKLNLTYNQVFRRWTDVIAPKHPEVEYSPTNKINWKKQGEELDVKIMKLFDDGGNFESAAKALGLTPNQVKKRWYRHLRYSNPEMKYVNYQVKRSVSNFSKKRDKVLVGYMARGFDYHTTADEMNMPYERVQDRWENKLAKDYPKIVALRALLF